MKLQLINKTLVQGQNATEHAVIQSSVEGVCRSLWREECFHEDSHDDEDFHQSHPRKRPVPRSPSLIDTSGLDSSSSSSKPDLKVLSLDSDLKNTTRTDDDDTIIISDNEDFNEGESSTNTNDSSDSAESSDSEDSLPMCKIPGLFLEGIVSPGSKYVTNFQENKVELVELLYELYNITIFGSKLPTKIKIVWNNRLTKTSAQTSNIVDNNQHKSMIELSVKVLDSAERLRSTLAHEMCHVACWLIDGEQGDNHGPLWQAYAKRVSYIHPELPQVEIYHNYTINYNFNYQCTLCDNRFGRFRKLPDNKYCLRCGGRLQLATM
ncbi:germ cell nuclear acidic protein-like [Ranitomeya variabilis]|uniref:germ cell nuclear acidic protein-like n=1 Tax=Ranitomeya variabilis TaxID=490064 RepID=UPI0040567BD5